MNESLPSGALALSCDATFWRNMCAHWHAYLPAIGTKLWCALRGYSVSSKFLVEIHSQQCPQAIFQFLLRFLLLLFQYKAPTDPHMSHIISCLKY